MDEIGLLALKLLTNSDSPLQEFGERREPPGSSMWPLLTRQLLSSSAVSNMVPHFLPGTPLEAEKASL